MKWFDKARLNLYRGLIDVEGHDIRVLLTTGDYALDQQGHEFLSDVTNEVSGPGYLSGGQSLTGKVLTLDPALNKVTFDADDPVWPGATLTAVRNAIFYDNDTTPKLLIGFDQALQDVNSTNAEFRVAIDAGGMFRDTTT